MAVDDLELLKRMATGQDRVAFSTFYDQHSPQVFGLLLKLLRNRTDAEDVLQEVFLQVWNQAGRFDASRSTPHGWVLMVARSRALDRLRKRSDTSTADQQPEPSTHPDPTRNLQLQESQEQVQSALGRLPPEQRDLIRLAFFDGFTHDQIATRTGLPLGTVKTRIRMGMLTLRERLVNSAMEGVAS